MSDRSGHVDLHAHYLAPLVVEAIERGEFAPHIRIVDTRQGRRIGYPGSTTRLVDPRMIGLDDRLTHLDDLGIDVQVLSPWIDTFGYDLPEDVSVRYHTLLNEGMAAAVQAHPDRLRFLASVPLPHTDSIDAVLTDARERLGAIGSMIGTNVTGRDLDLPEIDTLWRASERLRLPVELHPVDVIQTDRFARWQFDNFLGNPFDTTIAASSLIFGGVLDRYPGLAVILLHGGGYLPYAVGRLSHGRRVRHQAPELAADPIDYLRRFYYDTVVYDAETMRALERIVGTDRLLLGTDYPFDMEPDEPVGQVARWLGAPALETIAGTAAGLLAGGQLGS